MGGKGCYVVCSSWFGVVGGVLGFFKPHKQNLLIPEAGYSIERQEEKM